MLSSVVEVLNAIGVSYSANPALPARYVDLGHALMKSSLIIQLVVIALFALLATIFYRRCHQRGLLNRRVHTPLVILYVSMGLILARTIYRTIEHFALSSGGGIFDSPIDELSPLLRQEWYFWVFEAALMLTNSLMWNVWHPGHYLPANKNVQLTQDGITEVEGSGSDDRRPFLVTLIDPFEMCITSKPRTKEAVQTQTI